ncbi:General substrate transporter [Penicillium roqueforti FM164]|uniref:General substrate transporter n=1 Tax=Penicillium roqueforti (strain FM164) TaxID=1365484 RepID=W6QLQ5_PENRF|nr:General substrate transporter [Penicillium roqueforti FM164]
MDPRSLIHPSYKESVSPFTLMHWSYPALLYMMRSVGGKPSSLGAYSHSSANLSYTSFKLPQLLVGRIIIGMGIGTVFTMVPYGTIKATNRGKNVVIDGIFITSGNSMLLEQFWLFSYRRPVRVMDSFLEIPAALSLVLIIFIFFFPGLPRRLVLIGQGKQSVKELTRIRLKSMYRKSDARSHLSIFLRKPLKLPLPSKISSPCRMEAILPFCAVSRLAGLNSSDRSTLQPSPSRTWDFRDNCPVFRSSSLRSLYSSLLTIFIDGGCSYFVEMASRFA